MNAPGYIGLSAADADQLTETQGLIALFPLEQLQALDAHAATRCQSLLGHGGNFGIWETPEDLIEAMTESRRRIDLRRRLLSYLPEDLPASNQLEALLADGVLYLTRLGLLLRMGPAGLRREATSKPLDASTVALYLYSSCPRLVARGIERRLGAGGESRSGFAQALTFEDVDEFMGATSERYQLRRLMVLHARQLWADAPPQRTFHGRATAVRGEKVKRTAQAIRVPFPPLPDAYMAEMGQRVLWLIRDLGPNLINLLQSLVTQIGGQSFKRARSINSFIEAYFEKNEWRDRNGEVISKPPFSLKYNTGGGSNYKDGTAKDVYEWPPRLWSGVQVLAVTLQRAHQWLAMLVMAGRQGEVLTLKRDCVEEARDGQVYVNGKTYKASARFHGEQKESPPPDVLVFALAQQVQLVEACEQLVGLIDSEDPISALATPGTHLWASLGSGAKADHSQKLKHSSEVLIYLARTLDLDTRPGGKNVHPHRMRKTTARLAGIAIDGAQKVLMHLLGHEDVTTTLLYMQSDPAFAKEIDDVTREIRILRAEGLVEDMRAALHESSGVPYGGHGGGGAPVLSDAVRTHEEELHREGKEWGADTARELAILLTNNGESARLISPHVVCTKTIGEVGLCSQKKGSVVPGNCQVECRNHIEEATGRRDVDRIIQILVEHAEKNIAEGNWLPAQSNKRQLIRELGRYDDVNQRYRSMPNVQRILGWDE